MRVFLFSLFVVSILFSCHNKELRLIISASDTTRVLETALSEATSVRYMPSTPLMKKDKFNDPILLTSDVLPLNLFPASITGKKFKILPTEEICTTINRNAAVDEVSNYLIVRKFEKNDSGYYVQLQNLSCHPYGGGGSLGILFKKVKDSFVIVHRAATSIN